MLFKATRVYHSEAAPPLRPSGPSTKQTNQATYRHLTMVSRKISMKKKRCGKNGREKKADEKMTHDNLIGIIISKNC